jgi:hydroxymethylpyrimidine pyrophosphatase-like HAD family hydrolase
MKENIIEGQLEKYMKSDMGLTFEEKIKLVKLIRQINGWGVDPFKEINLEDNKNRLEKLSKSIQVRLSRSIYQNHYSNVNLMINFRVVKKINFIQCLIKRLDLAKK